MQSKVLMYRKSFTSKNFQQLNMIRLIRQPSYFDHQPIPYIALISDQYLRNYDPKLMITICLVVIIDGRYLYQSIAQIIPGSQLTPKKNIPMMYAERSMYSIHMILCPWNYTKPCLGFCQNTRKNHIYMEVHGTNWTCQQYRQNRFYVILIFKHFLKCNCTVIFIILYSCIQNSCKSPLPVCLCSIEFRFICLLNSTASITYIVFLLAYLSIR